MKVLQITSHYSPNLGGVETHLEDLGKALVARRWDVFVLSYRPLETKASWKIYEKKDGVQVLRVPWFPGFFYKLVSRPALEFLYLLPGLFLVAPFFLFFYNPNVIHAHGLVAGFVGVFWGKIFRKRVVVSLHNIYHFPKRGLYRSFVKWIFKTADFSMGLSKQSAEEIQLLGVDKNKIGTFTYWIDLERFKPENSKVKGKERLGWRNKFVVLLVGRLVLEKGVLEVLKAAKKWNNNITLAVAGSGPLEERIRRSKHEIKNLEFLGKLSQKELPLYYSAADVLIVPSVHEEGFGRVILESLACGTPVIGSNRGAIPEAMDETVGKLIPVTPENIRKAVDYFYEKPQELERFAKNARRFAEKRYSEKNVEKIISAYKQ